MLFVYIFLALELAFELSNLLQIKSVDERSLIYILSVLYFIITQIDLEEILKSWLIDLS